MLPPPSGELRLRPTASVRVLYADTDKMGVVYHATYLRFLEHGRVELIRGTGIAYAELERRGFLLPVTEVRVQYLAPARYDDVLAVEVGVALLTRVRLHFGYRITTLRPTGDDGETAVEVVRAETRHICARARDGRPTRFPDDVYRTLASCYTMPNSPAEASP